MITITDSAVKELRDLLERKQESPEEKGLRLSIERGGCAGMQYTMRISERGEKDQVVEKDGVRVFLDEESVPFLKDSQVDYVDTLNDSGFKITNPNAARTCGCGTSFEAAEAGKEPEYEPEEMDGSVCGDPDA